MSDQTIYPALRYRDADAAIKWLKAAVGATEHALHRDDDGGIAHAQLIVEGQVIMLGEARDSEFLAENPPGLHTPAISLYVAVDDPAAHHERATAAGAEIVRPLEHMDYGSHEYTLRDLEGNLWSFGTYAPQAADG